MAQKYEIITDVKSVKKYEISIWDGIEEYVDYEKLLETINKITKDDSVILNVSTGGGRCDVGFMLIERIKKIKCAVHVHVPYPTYSMGAIMALSGDSLTIEPGAFLMFHDYSGGSRGKGNEQLKSTEAYNEMFKLKFNAICQPFLSKKECENILEGQDAYIKWNDEKLELRMQRHFKGTGK